MLIRVAARPALDILVAALLAALLPDEPGCQSYMDRYLTIDPLPPPSPSSNALFNLIYANVADKSRFGILSGVCEAAQM